MKVSPELAAQLEQATLKRDSRNVVLTGIQSLDTRNQQFSVRGIRRVFRHAGKFEAKHRKYGLHLWYAIEMDEAAPVLEALSAYKNLPQVQITEPVYKKAIIGSGNKNFGPVVYKGQAPAPTLSGPSNDPLLGGQWHYDNTGQTGGTAGSDVSLFQAWGIETGSSDVIVAVTDGGIQVNHPDLAANMWVNTGEIPGNGLDDDNNGFVDDVNGYGFGDNSGEIAPDAHGTHVGGTIAAVTNNGVGVAGVAGGSGSGDGVRLMSCAAFGAVGTGGFAETYIYGADNGAVISQNSWGYTVPGVFEQAVLDAIDYFIAEAGRDEGGNQVGPMNGGIVIFAAGNSDSNEQHYPGFYEPTLAVSGTTHQDKKAWYSNFGPWVDIAAPGGETNSVAQQGVLSTLDNNQYGFFQGTSMACPHVSGVAALIISKYGGSGFTPVMLRNRLIQTVDDIDAADPPFAGLLGAGRLNAFAALQQDDGEAPLAITDLSSPSAGITTVTLQWTAPADSGSGSATGYDIRYSLTPIDESNFNSATAVADPPEPKPAGSAESFVVSGLMPGTTYYFAIKSSDFFGNVSAISNVISQATNFAPEIAVSPASLTENLQTAETSVQNLSIANNGEGPLNFQFAGTGGFASPSPLSGTVAAGDTASISINFSASGLLAGTYHQDLLILSNDPLNDSLVVPVTLNVTNNGTPIASVTPDSLDFGQVFEGGSTSKNISIHNGGSEPLTITGISSDNHDFGAAFSAPQSIAPFDTLIVAIVFSPDSIGASSGTISISTDDPVNAVLTVAVTGEGVLAPGIEVSPDSFDVSLNTGNTTTLPLTIHNPGQSNLEFAIEISSGASAATASKEIEIKSSAVSGGGEKQTGSTRTSAQRVVIPATGKLAAEIKVLILTPDDNITDMETILDAFDDVEADIFPASGLASLTVSDLAPYDVVFTSNNTQWLAGGGVSPATVGDVLADYVDQGGKVIVNQFAYSFDAWKMEGRFITEQYGPFTPSTTDANISVDLGEITTPDHPVMQDVNELSYTGFVQNVGLAPGATLLANWSNGEIFAAVNNNVVALNMLPSLGNGGSLQWDGDLPALYHNAIAWLGGASFVSVNILSGVVEPGQTLPLDVTFDAGDLAGGTYTASIDISSNAPGNELIQIPATLHVLGPEFTITPDSLYVELEKEQTTSRTLILSNNGTGNFTYNITVLDKGVSSLSVQQKRAEPAEGRRARRTEEMVQEKQAAAGRARIDLDGTKSIAAADESGRSRSSVGQLSVEQYGTGFEAFTLGDISGQEGWFGQFGNWTAESANPFGGTQHFRGLSDGLGLTLAFSPEVAIGAEDKSTASMKINVQGSGVTWQIIPQSPSAGLLNTRVQFAPDGTSQALVSDGAGGAFFENITAAVPSGYFDLTIEVDRATAEFNVYYNGEKVFTGQGFAGDIEQVVFLSLMEEAGPILDVDDFQIIDGAKSFTDPYITVSPVSGNLPAGESVAITVNFNTDELEFGTYSSDIKIDIAGVEELVVPAILRVFGDPAIKVDPTVLQATVPYREDTTHIFTISNTGGNPLTYSMQVIGAGTDMANLPASPKSKFANWKSDNRIVEKLAKDAARSAAGDSRQAKLEVLTGISLMQENFDGGTFPPAGWSVVDNEGTGVVWATAAFWGEGNYSGTGEAATASSDAAGPVEFDTELISPVINIEGYNKIAVQFNANYQNFANLDFLDVDIQVEGSSTWTNVLRWNEDHGSFRGTPGQFVTLSLDSYLGDATSFKLRWHYYDPNSDDFDWYAQVDDIVILGEAKTWLAVEPASGTVPVRGSNAIQATFDAADIEPGFYVAGILVSNNSTETPLVGVVASLDVMNPAEISVSPDSLYQELFKGQTASQTVTISNSGESPLHFSFEGIAAAAAPAQKKAPVVSNDRRTQYSQPTVKPDQAAAIINPAVSKLAGTEQYATSFEEFALGNINGQEGWSGQFGNWSVVGDNPFSGAQHFRGLSDGLGQSLAFSPVVPVGTDPISSTTMRINIDGTGTTWEVIPQSPTAQFVNTRFRVGPAGELSALVSDGAGGASFVTIPGAWPSGYVDVRIDVVRATSMFTVYINAEPIFTGQGFAGDIEQVVILSLMEEAGPTFDMDNFAILDGTPSAPWLLVSPKSGSVPSGGSANVTVLFNAEDLSEGTYTDTLSIVSNDPAQPVTSVPVMLVVDENTPPVISPVADITLLEKQVLNMTLTATDADDSVVNVSLMGVPSFVTLVSQSNGSATYKFAPQVGHQGEYDFVVQAQDARGATTIDSVHLSVLKFAVVSFSVVNIVTGEIVAEFTDAITLNRAEPEFNNLNIRANATPEVVGSVKFKINGSQRNIDSSNPYLLKTGLLSGLGNGNYTLFAEPFTQAHGHGQRGVGKTAVVTLIYATTVVKNFSLVNTSTGEVVMDFDDSVTVNTTDSAFANLNIRANTTSAAVGSVKFKINGSQKNIDNTNPYMLKSQVLQTLALGNHTILAEPFSGPSGHGTRGLGKTAIIHVTDGTSLAAARMAKPELQIETEQESVTLYPSPASDHINISVSDLKATRAKIAIMNLQGQVVLETNVSTGIPQRIELNRLNMSSGMYYMVIQREDGKREMKRFVKE